MKAPKSSKQLFAVAGVTCAVGHLAANVANVPWLRAVTKPPLMLLLAGHTACSANKDQQRLIKPLLAGLAFASAGDTALLSKSRRALLSGIALFAGTHLCYLRGCLTRDAVRALRSKDLRPVAMVAASYVLIGAALWRRLGTLRWPVYGYGLLLFGMVAAAYGTSQRLGHGAALFAFSDVMIALRLAGIVFPGQDALIGATYIAGQTTIALNWPACTSDALNNRSR